ncbi:hypothetical protein KY337_06605 [Candidatus Woesearchaeota archaeon]|nr:hypothetical protein [Candidatus Woesearchaeota archaeon]
MEYKVEILEKLAGTIDRLVSGRGGELYFANCDYSLGSILQAVAGVHPADLPAPDVGFRTCDLELDALFQHIIDPNNTSGTLITGGREWEANFIYEDIRRNGLGPNQLDRIAKECRVLIVQELEKQDCDAALLYLGSHVVDESLRLKARRDFVGILRSYSHRERATRDEAYLARMECFGRKIDVGAIRAGLPEQVTRERLYQIAGSILAHEIEKAEESGDFFDYYIRLDLLPILKDIGTEQAIERLKERRDDEREHEVVRQDAAERLEGRRG